MPTREQIEIPDGIWVDLPIIYQSVDYGQQAFGLRVDGAGNTFVASKWGTGNLTIIYVRKYSPTGVVLGKWNVVMQGQSHVVNPAVSGEPKIDGFSITPSGRDLIITASGHVTNQERQNPVALGRIVGVYVPYTGANPEDGKAPSFAPTPGSPDPGGGGVTEADFVRIQGMIDTGDHWVKDQLAYIIEHFIKPQIVADVAATLSGDPGPIASLLYGRIKDGSYEQLVAWQEIHGFKPVPTPVPKDKVEAQKAAIATDVAKAADAGKEAIAAYMAQAAQAAQAAEPKP